MADEGFEDLLDRLRGGDQEAAAELVSQYEPEIRRFVRYRLRDPSLKRIVESLDIYQSVMAKFFVHLSEGRLELHEPSQLKALLVTMARNKLYDKMRREKARPTTGGEYLDAVAAEDTSPSQLAIGEELVRIVRAQLTSEEQYLIDQKLSGRRWADLATELGKSPEALRKQFTRALDTAAKSQGLSGE